MSPDPITSNSTRCDVALVFPPLVTTNFGMYFPSTAVLAAYLASHGIASVQDDLNEAFALFLLDGQVLDQMVNRTAYGFETLALDAMELVAARIVARNRHLLFDSRGRHMFREDALGPGYLLNILARPYLIDLPVESLLNVDFNNWPVAQFYQTFYEWTAYVHRLPPHVHTVGISVPMGPQLVPAIILAQHIKTLRPQIKVIIGGPTISLMTEANLGQLLSTFTNIDAAVRFDGERPLEMLVGQVSKGDWEPTVVPGVSCYIDKEIIHTAPEAGIPLNSLPFAQYDPELLLRLAEPEIGIQVTRGCYWGECAYCDFVELYEGSPSFRTRTPKRVVEEIKYQQRCHDVKRFALITEAISPGFSRRFSSDILEQNLKIQWNSFAMVDAKFTDELFQHMVLAGCEYLVVGLETMIDRVLNLVHKAATRDLNVSFLREAKNAGITVHINLIPDLPTTTYQEALEALAEIEKLSECIGSVAIFPFEATRSSEIGRMPANFGLEVIEGTTQAGQAQFATNHLNITDPAMSQQERKAVIAVYKQFADSINGSFHSNAEVPFATRNISNETHLRLATDYVDFARTERGIQCFNWITRQRFLIPNGLSDVIRTLESSPAFNRLSFIQQFQSQANGEELFNQLVDHYMLIVCSK